MPIHHAVLALLRGGPSYGYELKAAFESAVGPQWGPLNIGHLYQVLDRLTRDGYVTSARLPQEVKPDRVMYEMTGAGADELAGWMSSPSPRTAGFRDDFFLKVMAAARTADPDVVQRVIDTQRAHLLRELRNLETLRRDGDNDPVVALLLTAATRHVAADLTFLDDAETELLRPATLARLALSVPERPTQDRELRPGRVAQAGS